MSDEVPEISIVIVSFNTCDLLRRCLAALRASVAGRSFEAIVIDNGSSDGSVAMVKKEFPATTLVEVGENLGFGRATNRGTALSRGRVVVWLNSDCEPDPGSLAELARYLEAIPSAGAVGPSLTYEDGRLQPSAQAFPTGARVLWHFLGVRRLARTAAGRAMLRPLAPRGSAAASYLDALDSSGGPRNADWLSGACIAVRREVLDRVGLFDERYFMYCEDTDWCRRVHDAGLEVSYLPTARIIHHVGASRVRNPMATYHYYRSLFIYLKRYRPGSIPAVRAVMGMGSLLNALGSALARPWRPGQPNPWWLVLRLCATGNPDIQVHPTP